MFTGIVEEKGSIKAIQSGAHSIRLTASCRKVLDGSRIGDSIAVNGICLTAAELGPDWFIADVMPETMRRTNLQHLRPQDPVNLERALKFGDRLGGHLVSGHIDGTGKLIRRIAEDNAIWLTIEADPAILHYVIAKGSIALNGVSLTVAGINSQFLQVSLIPHTADSTTLKELRVGDLINIECDLIGKYIEKLLLKPAADPCSGNENGLTMEFLQKNGFG